VQLRVSFSPWLVFFVFKAAFYTVTEMYQSKLHFWQTLPNLVLT
jgi:hypothetical protein